MLKKFFMNALSSFVGAWMAIVILGGVLVLVIFGLIARFGQSLGEDVKSVEKHSVLVLELSGVIEERENGTRPPSLYDLANGDFTRPQTLETIVKGLAEAKDNNNIDALRINCNGVAAAPATLNAIRDAVLDFKKSGKKVYSYGDSYSMGDLFVASVADSVFVNPGGEVALNGIGGTSIYLKKLFDKLGISFQVAKVGTFKSAVEPYISDEMSAPARAQLDTLYGNMWSYIRENVASVRKGLSAAKIDSLINVNHISWSPVEDAIKNNLVDKAVYERTFDAIIGRLVGKDADKVNYIGCGDIVNKLDLGSSYKSKNQIVVLYACGEIVDGNPSQIDFNTLVPLIVKFADDENVKGMVLRVNSPGGSAYGSEQIGEALDYFMSKNKKLAVSMGDYAASGGYWISAGADVIFADPLTITGSIGIFGLFPNIKNLADNIGVSPQFISTNPSANFPNLFKPMSDEQLSVLQKYVERGYEKFVGRVAKGRKMSVGQVKSIAEGRVWDALTAQKIHLVDSIGGLDNAIDWVKSTVDEKNLGVVVYPRVEMSVWDFIPTSTSMSFDMAMKKIGGEMYTPAVADKVKDVLTRKPVQARMLDFSVSL